MGLAVLRQASYLRSGDLIGSPSEGITISTAKTVVSDFFASGMCHGTCREEAVKLLLNRGHGACLFLL